MWSLGCVLYELCTLTHAFIGNSLYSLIFRIVNGTYEPIDRTQYSSQLSELLSRLLDKDPAVRPTCRALLGDDYVRMHIEKTMLKVCTSHCDLAYNGAANASVTRSEGALAAVTHSCMMTHTVQWRADYGRAAAADTGEAADATAGSNDARCRRACYDSKGAAGSPKAGRCERSHAASELAHAG